MRNRTITCLSLTFYFLFVSSYDAKDIEFKISYFPSKI